MAQTSTINLMISCKQATELLDKKAVLKLSGRENLALKLHVAICEACKRYKKQTQFLENILKLNFKNSNPDQVPQHTNEELKGKIFEYLKKNQ
ncbi:zf-HC2 domain-containing protein [Sphingobacterium alkalisoli]|uniref:Zf-HC2 domain-containing protein n=1 Tax=Sphingobacterium alkalisoli TaxID=1874115 RepID=A0A4U0H0J3_9SPHI|nr:zf-HC2 domain-containing protein [Sphingobacterium alkalisoli]TJY63712.1 zf-HC2 domain-containing protein [Sphingobacterium alkalisoli]GGH25371.1 hypothetical protein GCM10011418_33940 [Sphingobacterium alkalisoli]